MLRATETALLALALDQHDEAYNREQWQIALEQYGADAELVAAYLALSRWYPHATALHAPVPLSHVAFIRQCAACRYWPWRFRDRFRQHAAFRGLGQRPR